MTYNLSVYKQCVIDSIKTNKSRHNEAIFQIPGIPFKMKSRFHIPKRFKTIKLAMIHTIEYKTIKIFSTKKYRTMDYCKSMDLSFFEHMGTCLRLFISAYNCDLHLPS
jgi:hypothetical protein